MLMGPMLKGARLSCSVCSPALHPDEQHAAAEGPAGENV